MARMRTGEKGTPRKTRRGIVSAVCAMCLLLIAALAPAAAFAGSVTATLKRTNYWQEGSATCSQYEVGVTNGTSSQIGSWTITIDVDADTVVRSKWNCDYTLSDGKLTITPAGYAQTLAPGASSQGIGLIVTSGASTQWTKYKVDYTMADTGASGSDSSTTGSAGSGAGSGGNANTGSGGSSLAVPVAAGISPLHVSGTQLCDNTGNPVRLQGVSLHGLGFDADFTRYVNQDAFRTLRDDWGANAVRLPVYTQEYGGWCTNDGHGMERNREILRSVVNDGVTYATDLGMYAIIDWHILSDGNPQTHQDEAVDFFREMSSRYKNCNNVIYEICNEPNGSTDWGQIKAYADKVIPVIRDNDPDALIICGTPNWSQDVDQVAADPLPYDNVMYACHFYAATHGDYLRQKVRTALAAGTPVFISESSICEASGNGNVDYGSANAWKQLIRDNGLSYIEWSLCNKPEAASAILSSCGKTSWWAPSELSATGQWYRAMMRELAGDVESSKVVRLQGADRFGTMGAITREGFTQHTDAVILVRSDNFPDALTASSLAGITGAPIFITPTDGLDGTARSELARLRPSTIVVCGREAAVSDATARAAQAAAGASNIVRLGGATRSGTAVQICANGPSRLGKSWQTDTVVIATGANFADALSIAPYCYAKGIPILLTENKDTISQETLDTISRVGAKRFVVVGGPAVVSEGVVSTLQARGLTLTARLGGADRYETSRLIAEFECKNGMAANGMALASGGNFPDALCGAALCGKTGSVLLLVSNDNRTAIDGFARGHASVIKQAYVFGGPNAVSGTTFNALAAVLG